MPHACDDQIILYGKLRQWYRSTGSRPFHRYTADQAS